MWRRWAVAPVTVLLGLVSDVTGFYVQPVDTRVVSAKSSGGTSSLLLSRRGLCSSNNCAASGPSYSSRGERAQGTKAFAGDAVAITAAIAWGQESIWEGLGYEEQEGLLTQREVEELEQAMLDYYQGRGFALHRVVELFDGLTPEEVAERWPSWRANSEALFSLGFTTEDVTTIMLKSSSFFHDLDAEADIRRTVLYLWQDLGLERWGKIGQGNQAWRQHKFKVIAQAPEILRRGAEGGIKETVATLEQVGMSTKSILDAAFRFPTVLCVAPSLVFVVSAFLSSKEVGFKARDLGALYRRNPWLLHPQTVSRLRPVVAYLKSGLEVQRVHNVIRGFPQIVMRSVEDDLHPRVAVLQSLGIPPNEVGRMVEMFPTLLSLDVDEQIMPVLYFLQAELELSRYEVWMLLRAFPGTLGLDVETSIRPAVLFIRDIGIRNVKSFVKRHPPVLGYPVEWELGKKWTFLRRELGLGLRELDAFPAYFSYSLVGRIVPRMRYLMARGRRVDSVLLRVALTVGDAAFADLAGVSPEEYAAYEAEYRLTSKLERARQRGRLPSSEARRLEEESVCD